ncbi:MAG TPA: PAS domain-containing sensor histidine kinase [Candidatus Thermoplasmatota archaeon]|nr:PAS domain-containing sensor histidine kinase [Candidatus Thermoplasmatota archaeon]
METSTELEQITQKKRYELSSHLFDVIQDALLIFNTLGVIIDANEAACSLYQYTNDELCGLHCYDLIFEDDQSSFDEFIKSVSKGKSFATHSTNVKKDGSLFSAEIKGFSFLFHNNQLLLAIVRNIPEKQKAFEKSKITIDKYERLLQNIPDVVWTTDQYGDTLFITENIKRIFGFSQEEILKRSSLWFDHIHPNDLKQVKQAFEELFTHNIPFDVEYRLKTKSGKWVWISDRSTNIYKQNGRLVADGVLSDISERKRIEKSLKQSEIRFKTLFEHAPDAYYINDFEGHFIDGNKGAEKLLGYKKEELVGKKFTELSILPKKYIPKAIKNTIAGKKGKPTGPDEFVLNRKDGSKVIAEINTIPVTLNGQQVVLGVAHNVTRWKQAEMELREAKDSFETIFNTMADPVMILDKKGKFLELTDKVKDYTGFEKSEIIGKNFLKTKLLTSKSKAICIKNLFKRMAGVDVKPYEVEARTKDGKIIPFEVNAERITYKGKPADLIVFRDISSRVAAEKKLRQSEKIHRNLFQNAQVGLFRTSVENGQILECNNQLAHMFGFDNRKEFIKKYQLEKFYVDPSDRKDLIELLKKEGVVTHFEAAFYRKDKTVFWARYSAKIDKKNNWIEGVFEDITDLKKAESRLKNKHEQLKSERKQLISIFDSINHAIYVADPKTYEILFTNSKLRESLKKDVTGKRCYEALQNKNHPCEFCTNDIILKNKGKPYKWEYHNTYTKKDYELTDKIITWSDGRDVRFELAIDITDRKKALEEVKKSHQIVSEFNKELEQKVSEKTERIENLLKQKDEFINQLGHDLKNPLGPLVNLLPIVEKHTSQEKDKKMLQVAQRNVNYMKNLVQNTLELARLNSPNTTLSKKDVNLRKHIEESIEQNNFLFKEKKISVSVQISKDIIVHADIIRLEELFNNLLNNAVKYNKEHGHIKINAFEKGDTVTISIEDDGIGMTSEQIDHIFDEFYKADESRHDFESSGLGMAICKQIVEKHNGTIWAESDGLDKGSTFFVTLPKKPVKKENIIRKINKNQSSYHAIKHEVDDLIKKRL